MSKVAVMDDSRLAEELRLTIGRLVRTVRAVDTMPPGEAAVLGYLDRGGPLTTAEIAQQRGSATSRPPRRSRAS